MTPAVALFRSLADETRLRIVQRLAAGEAREVDLTVELGLAQSRRRSTLPRATVRGSVRRSNDGQTINGGFPLNENPPFDLLFRGGAEGI
ncbi:hypothetical protein [Micromonospora zamorensis]|uniref:hypothetical protein n=1 Tax=Micromonospora zamorensis TaxID=709883 RepID=UPI0033A06E60